MRGHRGGGPLCGIHSSAFVPGGAGLGPELRGVGIEPQNDLGLAAGDVAGQPVTEGCAGGPHLVQSVGDQPFLTDFLRPEPAENFGAFDAAIWIFSPVCGLTP